MDNISKFFISTLVAAAAMTSTAWAEGTEIKTSEKENSLQNAVSSATAGDTIVLDSGETVLNGNVEINTNVKITGTAVIDWTKGQFFIGRGTNAADTIVTFENANITSTNTSAAAYGTGFHVSNAEKDSSSKKNGTLNIINSYIVTDYIINKNVINVSGNGTIGDVANLKILGSLGVAGRVASETVDGEDHTAVMNITNGAYVSVLNENGLGIGNYTNGEAKGVLNIVDSKYEANALTIREKGTVNLTNGIIKITGTLTNNGALVVSGTSTVDAKISGEGFIQIKDGALTLDKGVETETFVVGKSGYVDAEVDAGTGATVTVSGINKITGNNDTATWIGFANDTEWSADNKGKFVLNITGKDTMWDGGSTHIANAGQLNITDGAKAELTYTKVRGGLTVDASTVAINSQMNVYGEENYTNGDNTNGEAVLSNADFKVLNGADVDISGSLTIGKNGNVNRVGTVTVSGTNSDLSVGGTITVYSGSAIKIDEGAALTANVIAGTGDIVLAGTVNVAESLTTGNLTIVAGATLNIETVEAIMLLSESASISFDTLTIVADNLEAGSELLLEDIVKGTGAGALQAEIVASKDDSIKVISNGKTYDVKVGANGSMTVIPEPSAFGLLAGLGALALVGARRRRR